MGRIRGIAVEDELVELVPQPRGLRDAILALGHEQFADRGVVFRNNMREHGRFTPDIEGDRLRIQPIVLVAAASPPPPSGCPARVDLVDRRTAGDDVLGEPAAGYCHVKF